MEVTAERMTLEEMQAAYPRKWVLFDEVEDDPEHLGSWLTARPRIASDDREGAWTAWDQLGIRSGGVMFMGPRDPDLIFAL